MPTTPKRPNPAGLIAYVSEWRFGLMMLICALALAIMLAVVYRTLGFVPIWAVHAVAA